jgi:hypothetical protein
MEALACHPLGKPKDAPEPLIVEGKSTNTSIQIRSKFECNFQDGLARQVYVPHHTIELQQALLLPPRTRTDVTTYRRSPAGSSQPEPRS